MKRMHVAINTLPLLSNKAGAERYTENILKNLAMIDAENNYTLLLNDLNKNFYKIDQKNFNNMLLNVDAQSRIRRIIAEQCYIPFLIKKTLDIDIYFSPCNIAPMFISTPKVTMLFDVHWILFPQLFNRAKMTYLKRAIRSTVKGSQRILTISNNSKKDIVKIFGVQEDKVKVTYLGVDPAFKVEVDKERVEGVLSKYEIEGKFVLSVCQLHKRKNLLRLLLAFSHLKDSNKIRHTLVLAGGPGDGTNEIEYFLTSTRRKDILVTGCIPDEDIRFLYNAADLFVYPSLYEGFGLPVIEAMACGTPVVTSNVSSLPEVAGDAAILVNPYSVEDIADAIYRVISDKELKEDLTAKGLKRAAEFSWEKAARETLKVFEEVYNETKRP
jgi:glycosyltransferase involved in cell wall biosynthesis